MSLINDSQVIQKVVETEIVGPFEPGGGLPVHIVSPLETNGAVPINIQDQHTPAFDVPFSRIVGVPRTLDADTVLDAWSIEVTAGHGITAGGQILLQDMAACREYRGKVVTVDGLTTLNMSNPLNHAYAVASSTVLETVQDLNVDGSVTRQSFYVGTCVNIDLDITRIMFQMTMTNPPEFNDFGDIAGGLLRGVVLRVVNGTYTNLWNIHSNADMALLMYDVTMYEQTKVFGVNGIAGRLTYAGPPYHGVTIRLKPGEFMEVIIQDDLRDLLSFRLLAAGHIVTD